MSAKSSRYSVHFSESRQWYALMTQPREQRGCERKNSARPEGQTGFWSIVAKLAVLCLAVAIFLRSTRNASGVEIVLAGNAIGASRLRLVAPPFASRLL